MKLSKEKIALFSVLTGIFLTLIKGIAGILTSSLGLLSEALHSFLDFGAAFFAYFSIKIASKPPDERHTFGHGKAENLSALFQSFLLLVTSIWIIYEAIQRIFFKKTEVKINFFAFIVIIISIIFAFITSTLLKKGAKFYKSQALEADGLHYTTDIYSSLVVLIGLIGTKFGFNYLDSLAGIVVSLFVLFAIYNLSSRAISDLMDTTPKDLKDNVLRILEDFEKVKEVEKIRTRKGGSTTFIELTLKTSPFSSVAGSHDLSREIEEKLRVKLSDVDVIIHFHPSEEKSSFQEKIQDLAKNFEEIKDIHKIYLFKNNETGKITLCMHVVFRKDESFEKAHTILDNFEKLVKEKIPEIDNIHSHIEKIKDFHEGKIENLSKEEIKKTEIKLKENENILDLHEVSLYKGEEGLSLSCHIIIKKDLDLEEVHKIASWAEEVIKSSIRNLKFVTIHTEPEI